MDFNFESDFEEEFDKSPEMAEKRELLKKLLEVILNEFGEKDKLFKKVVADYFGSNDLSKATESGFKYIDNASYQQLNILSRMAVTMAHVMRGMHPEEAISLVEGDLTLLTLLEEDKHKGEEGNES